MRRKIYDDKTGYFRQGRNMSRLHYDDIIKAQDVIQGIADGTPLIPAPSLSDQLGVEILLKLENMQPIGAFKLRGALNAVAHIPDGAAGVVAASTGNHGRGVAYAAAHRGLRAVVCMVYRLSSPCRQWSPRLRWMGSKPSGQRC